MGVSRRAAAQPIDDESKMPYLPPHTPRAKATRLGFNAQAAQQYGHLNCPQIADEMTLGRPRSGLRIPL